MSRPFPPYVNKAFFVSSIYVVSLDSYRKTRTRKSNFLDTRHFLVIDTVCLLEIQQSCCMCGVTFKVLLSFIFFLMMGSMLRKTFDSVNTIAFLPSQIQTQSLNLSYMRAARSKVRSGFLHFLLVSLGQPTNLCWHPGA